MAKEKFFNLQAPEEKALQGEKGGHSSHKFHQHLDAIQTKQLEAFHQKYLNNYQELLSAPHRSEYRRALTQYLQAAEKAAIPIERSVAIDYHKEMIYEFQIGNAPSCPKGQSPGIVMFSNTSEDYGYLLFSEGVGVAMDDVWKGGAFGASENIWRSDQIGDTNDLVSAAFITGHMIGKHHEPYNEEKTTPPYITFSGAYRSNTAGGARITQERSMDLAKERQEKHIVDWLKAGFDVVAKDWKIEAGKILKRGNETPYLKILDKRRGAFEKIYLPVILHDISACEYYVVENGKKSGMEDWIREKGLDKLPVVAKHLENLAVHRTEADFFSEFVRLTRGYKSTRCVESRVVVDIGSSVSMLGGIPTAESRFRMLSNPLVNRIDAKLHFDCGAIKTAIALHYLGETIGNSFMDAYARVAAGELIEQKENGVLNGHYTLDDIEGEWQSFGRALKDIMRGEFYGFDTLKFKAFFSQIGHPIPDELGKSVDDLFKSTRSDMRYTMEYMAKVGLLEFDEKMMTVVMPVALELEKRIGSDSPILPRNRSTSEQMKWLKLEEELTDEKHAHLTHLQLKREREYVNRITLLVAIQQQDAWIKTMNDHEAEIRSSRVEAAKEMNRIVTEAVARIPAVRVLIDSIETPRRVLRTDGNKAWDLYTKEEVDVSELAA